MSDDRCVECGGDNAVTRSNHGKICFPCQARLNAEWTRRVREGGLVTQGIDPDGPPVHCMVRACNQDATITVRWGVVIGDKRELRLSACGDHYDTWVEVLNELRSGYSTIGDEVED